jgi:hypothetical protein
MRMSFAAYFMHEVYFGKAIMLSRTVLYGSEVYNFFTQYLKEDDGFKSFFVSLSSIIIRWYTKTIMYAGIESVCVDL